jgi:hypothetical protein
VYAANLRGSEEHDVDVLLCEKVPHCTLIQQVELRSGSRDQVVIAVTGKTPDEG